MKKHDMVEVKSVQMALVEWRCDCCGRSLGVKNGDLLPRDRDATATLRTDYFVGENVDNDVDICYECGGWLISNIRSGTIRRQA